MFVLNHPHNKKGLYGPVLTAPCAPIPDMPPELATWEGRAIVAVEGYLHPIHKYGFVYKYGFDPVLTAPSAPMPEMPPEFATDKRVIVPAGRGSIPDEEEDEEEEDEPELELAPLLLLLSALLSKVLASDPRNSPTAEAADVWAVSSLSVVDKKLWLLSSDAKLVQ